MNGEGSAGHTHNEVTTSGQSHILQAGTVEGSVYIGDAALAQAQADALAVHRRLEATYDRLDATQRQLIDQIRAQSRDLGTSPGTAEPVQVGFHPADHSWALWIADTLRHAGYAPVLVPVTEDALSGTTRTVVVLSDDYLAAVAMAAEPDWLPVLVRNSAHGALPAHHLRLVGVRADRAASLLVEAVAATSGRRRPPPPSMRVRDLDDPVLFGVHPSPTSDSRVPRYVRRDVENRLERMLAGNVFVVVVGDAAAGKTRMAYEFMRARMPDHWFVVPDDVTGLTAALDQADATDACVVWLDELERYLEPGGLTAATVSSLLRKQGRHLVILSTMRAQEHAMLSPRWESRIGDERGQWWRSARDVLRLAHEVHLDTRWSKAELARAASSSDPRVREAVRHAGSSGLAEYLAAGPQLLAEWRDAWSVGVRPRGAAIVAAAVDAARAGLRDGVGIDLLRRLHTHYLKARGGRALRPESFTDAVAWATELVPGTSALLVSAGKRRYLPFGYLIDATDGDVPEATWRTLIERASAEECWHVAQSAYARRLLDLAESAFRRAAEAGNPAAELSVADCIGEAGRRRDALASLHIIVEERTRRLGPRHPDVLDALRALGSWTGRVGDLRGAVAIFELLVDERASAFGATHPDTLAARHALANWCGRAGDLPTATGEYRRLVDDLVHLIGQDEPQTLAARHELANWLGRAGCQEEALAEHESVLVARQRVLGPDHVDTLRSRHRTARFVCDVRGPAAGLPLLQQVVVDRTRVLGGSHPDTLRSRAQFARWTGRAGRAREAAELYRRLALDSDRTLGARHPDTLRYRHQEARWGGESGDHARAEAMLRRIIADWTALLGALHPYTLISRYRLATCLHDGGDLPAAIDVLASLAADDDSVLGAEHPYACHAGELLARWQDQLAERSAQGSGDGAGDR
ncbi:tetratricopeptide repeat protein [Lentzea sp. NPDC058436]|uniref:tetratricopeptide repeat protein n=1 Tax=Lentzea sp. NPDC058436 TaxID=3346499 RepID=UPI003661D9DF